MTKEPIFYLFCQTFIMLDIYKLKDICFFRYSYDPNHKVMIQTVTKIPCYLKYHVTRARRISKPNVIYCHIPIRITETII